MNFGLLQVFYVELKSPFPQNLELNPLFEPQGEIVPVILTMIGYKC